MEPNNKKGVLVTVDKALSLLKCFSTHKPDWSLTELSREIKQPKSVVYRILHTLKERDFIEHDKVTKRYRLGLLIFQLGFVVSSQMDLRKCALQEMKNLSNRTGETVILSIVAQDQDKSICIEKIDSLQSVKVMAEIGRSLELYAGAPQKVLLANFSEEEIDRIIPDKILPVGPQTITDTGYLRKHLIQIREKGYAISREERSPEVGSVAGPIKDQTGKVNASLAVAVPLNRFGAERVEELIKYVSEHCEQISRLLGFIKPSAPQIDYVNSMYT